MRTLAAWFLIASVACAEDVALVGGTFYSSPGAQPLTNATVLIKDGRIVQVGDESTVPIAADATRIACAGRWIVAGFWNSHVHVLPQGLLHASEKPAASLQVQLDQMFNRWGFTHVFDLASDLENTLALRARIESGELRGPAILTTGEPLWTKTPIYVRHYLQENGVVMRELSDPAEATVRVDELARRGASGIKLFTGSMQGEDPVENMPLEIAVAAARAAHERQLVVFAHAHDEKGFEVAVAAGVDVLAHTTADSIAWTPERVERLKQARIALMPSLTLYVVEARRAHLPQAVTERWLEQLVSQVRAYSGGGGEILFGTDIGYIEEYDTSREMELMGSAGMDSRQILASLTTAPAVRFGRKGETGTLVPGAAADLVVLNADPMANPQAFSDVRLTLRAGRIIYQQP